MDTVKIYHKPPLPFNGNKSKWIAGLIELAEKGLLKFPDGTIILDLFGGSGVLSQCFAKLFPKCKIIYNDFDHYTELLTSSSTKKINDLKWALRNALKGKGYKKNDKLSDGDAVKVRTIIKKFYPPLIGDPKAKRSKEMKEYISPKMEKIKNIICSQVCFSGRNNLEGDLYYKLTNDYPVVPDYLPKNVTIVHEDYKTLYKRYEKHNNIFIVLDPPYLSTMKAFYSNYWGINETINILDICVNKPSILFESDKSEILGLVMLMGKYIKFDYIMSENKKLFNKSHNTEYAIWFNYKKYLNEKGLNTDEK